MSVIRCFFLASIIQQVISVNEQENDVPIRFFPHTVAVFVRPLKEVICGGAILTNKHILTSASCHQRNLKHASQRGKLYIKAGPQTSPITRNVSHSLVNKCYKRDNGDSNIAVLVLTRHFKLMHKLQPVNIPEKWPNVNQAKIAGWGDHSYSTSKPYRLKYLNATIFSQAKCSKIIKKGGLLEYMHDGILCAGNRHEKERRILPGSSRDEGLPLVIRYNKQVYAIGLYSMDLLEPPSVAIYTNLTTYYTWIMDRIAGKKQEY